MAEKRTINIDINNNADEAAKDFENFAKATNVANDSVEGLNKTFEEVYGEIQPLTTRMGEAEDRLYELAAAGDTTSKEYQQLLNKVGQYRKVQIQTDLAVDAAATTMGQKLGGALGGASAGFAAVQGVMGLVGSESEELEKALLKVQSALAIQQGVQGIREAIPAFKQLGASAMKALKGIKTGIAATGVGLLVVAVGAIVAYWDEITELLGVNNKSLEEQLELEKEISDQKAKQKSEMEEVIRNNNNHIERRIKIRKLEEDIKDLSIDQEGNQDAIYEKQLEILDLKKLQLGIEINSLDGLLSKEEKVNKEIELAIIGRERRRLIAQKAFDDAEKADEKAQARRDKKKTDEEAEIERQKELARLEQEAIDRMVEEEIALQQTFDAIQRENEDRFRTEQENEILLVEEKYDTLEAMAFGNAEALDQIEIARLNELNEIKQKFADEEVVIEEKKEEQIKATQEQKIAAVKNTLSTIANLAQLFAGESEREQKKAFKIQKAANIAQATIDTYSSAVSSYNSLAGIPVVGPVLGGAAAAAAVTAGLLNIKSIAQQEFGGGVGDQPAVPSDVGGGGAPQFNVVGDSGVNQLAQLQQQPTQAYVVSGEVTTAQALDRNRVQNATL